MVEHRGKRQQLEVQVRHGGKAPHKGRNGEAFCGRFACNICAARAPLLVLRAAFHRPAARRFYDDLLDFDCVPPRTAGRSPAKRAGDVMVHMPNVQAM